MRESGEVADQIAFRDLGDVHDLVVEVRRGNQVVQGVAGTPVVRN